ncbi:MAG: T9SS type A sorting domain-containing protein [Chitinophagaceae bacterium]|nr:T9SS type A sorting domain-containing protein [Chitinophagaceae bacterium]
MKKTILIFAIICVSIRLPAQSPLNWTSPVVVNSSVGTDWPRVALSHSTPVVAWGDFESGKIFCRRCDAGNFGPEIQLTPDGLAATVFSLTGPDLKASGDTVYVIYVNQDATHSYLHRSFDAGVTFSDTLRIDNIGNNFLRYSSVDLLPGGNPVISYAKLDENFSNPQYVVTKSLDGGNTFSSDVPVTATLGADPCDCCPGSIIYHDGVIAVIYRNAINDVRDMRAAISHDGGNTYELGIIDNNNWIIESCPSSGGEGVIIGDSLVSVFMNGVNGNKCFVSTLNINTLQPGFEKPLFNLPNGASQNHPAIVASGDTIAAVWEQIIAGHRNILFSYSLTGASGLGAVVDTISNVLAEGFHTNPDIAYSNGTFYVVFADGGAGQIYLMKGMLYEISGVQNTSVPMPFIQVAGNPQGDAINIFSNQIVNEACSVSVYNMNGSMCWRQELKGLQHSQLLKTDRALPNGIYLVSIVAKDFSMSGRMLIAH